MKDVLRFGGDLLPLIRLVEVAGPRDGKCMSLKRRCSPRGSGRAKGETAGEHGVEQDAQGPEVLGA